MNIYGNNALKPKIFHSPGAYHAGLHVLLYNVVKQILKC